MDFLRLFVLPLLLLPSPRLNSLVLNAFYVTSYFNINIQNISRHFKMQSSSQIRSMVSADVRHAIDTINMCRAKVKSLVICSSLEIMNLSKFVIIGIIKRCSISSDSAKEH